MEIPFPYQQHGQRPQNGRPTILGADTRTEFYRLAEYKLPVLQNSYLSDGAECQFTRNGIVTGIKALCTAPWFISDQAARLEMQVVKNGSEHLFTNGKTPERIHPFVLTQQNCPWLDTWIPVDAGEIWRTDLFVPNDLEIPEGFQLDYSLALRVERFLEKPKSIPPWLSQSIIYKKSQTLPELSSSTGIELDFRADCLITGMSAITNYNFVEVPPGLLSGVELDILLEGTIHLSNGFNTLQPLDINDISPIANPWMPIFYEASQHEKWQVFARNRNVVARTYNFLVRAEEQRRPWERW
jgi:hypothetical protein